MVTLIEAIILSIVQGITEWFPVSSKSHLYLLQSFFGFQSLSFDIFLHLASVLAVIILFWKDIISLLNFRNKENLRYISYIIIATIPAVIAALLFRHWIEATFYETSNLFYLGIFFVFSGVFIYSTRFFKPNKDNLNWIDALFIGTSQAIALLPGISRSGTTISSGMLRGIKKDGLIKFSFLMSIPVILGAGILEAKDIVHTDVSYDVLIVSFIVTFLVSVMAIKVLLKILKSDKFYLFGIYNIILGILVLIYSYIY